MKVRALLASVLGCLLAASCYGGFTARLWFKNVTTGYDGPGAVAVSSGDVVEIRFSFHRTDNRRPTHWTILQMAMDLSRQSLMSRADANSWQTGVDAAFRPSSAFIHKTFWQPSSGVMNDQGVDPSDRRSAPVTQAGVYALVGVIGSRPESQNIDMVVFRFRVAPRAVRRSVLRWLNEDRKVEAGVATGLMDDRNRSHRISDNWLVVR